MSNSLAMESNFAFVLDRIAEVTFQMQSVELPSITLSEQLIPAKPIEYSRPGERLIFDKLNISFLVDENLNNYQSVMDWMWECVNVNKCIQGIERELLSDAVLTILNKKKKSIRNYRFHDCFPVMLGPLMLSTTNTENKQMSCTVTLAYSHYENIESTVSNTQLNSKV